MATDNLQEGSEITPEAFEDLQKRLAKAEKKLDKAKSRAQATMQEIWQLDVKLKEEEERANQAEARLAELEAGGGGAVSAAPGANESALAEIQEELERVRKDAAQLEEMQEELEAARQEAAQLAELRDEIEVLRDELQKARTEAAQVGDTESETEELRRELESARQAAEELRRQVDELGQQEAGTDTDELQRRLDEVTQDRESLMARIKELEASQGEAGSDEALAEAREMIASLQARLESAGGGGSGNGVAQSSYELLENRLSGARIALHEAEERARLAEEKIAGVGSSTGVFEGQLADIQSKLREAEERALEWEERFHRSEERATKAEQAAFDGDSERLVLEFQDRISELETELAEVRLNDGGESTGGVSLEEYQRLEKELDEFQAELEEANRRAEEAESRADVLEGQTESEMVAQLKERLQLSEERGQLLQEKAQQSLDKLELSNSKLEDLNNAKERMGAELAEARAELEKARAEAGQAAQVGLASGAVESRLQEALQRARDAELKANQFEIKLQKAMGSLSEYEQRANESDRETQRLAFQDGLTGLPNLNLIRQYLEFTVKQVQRYNRASALLVVDLDRFKLINDAMGFKAGDELLGKVAERLQTAIRESDALGRKGEDEFLILLSELITGDDDTPTEQKTNMIRKNIAIVVNRISECLSRPFNIQGQKFYVRASIGVSICPNDADSAQAMLEHADSAMYHAKETGRGRCVFYNNELHKRQERRLAMDSQLRLAMEKGEFVLQYQPIIEVIKGKGTIVGVEALLRWNHRIDGLLEPAAFLGIAEETGLIVQLGQWVCRQSCWQLRQWLSQGHQMFVSFNVSTRQMLQADLAEMILGSVEEFGLQPGLVFVEVAEGGNVEEVDLTERVVANLGRNGIRVAIDDFGVGYSSISRMELDHIQFLKIDPSLVGSVQQDKAKTNICEAAIRLSQSLEIFPIAEGVETMQQAKFLTKAGCRYMQGYFFERPVDAAKITAMLEEKRAWKI
ncbi:MAG: EAL domain-containing protein [Candidatus Eremiobacteraeota bacterium]|nr:EAL domain-containing protein [Candidatus Eremiobacteraeota bacterium]